MFQKITLEMSLKPFKQTDEAYVRGVAAGVFEQWRPLLKGRSLISIMLWVGDGSELLDYTGSLEDPFEWCRFFGTANLQTLGEGEPLETSLHERRQDYIPNPPQMTYGTLKRIVSCLKEEGQKAFPEATVRVGETFDIGPEFAISDFKYRRHTELCSTSNCDGFGFLDATATLSADTYSYAAYPNGVPEGTPFGRFLGKQANRFLADLGFDFLWLSNGLGFSADPWSSTGKIFDGERYYPERLETTKSKVFSFWKLFREECPFPLETRGTNNSVGIDYASDGVPLYDIYRADLDITAPPNSPWAALNDNYGLEMMGHMTRICDLPNRTFPFRYYLHDPWWINSPWYDRYDGSPCDVYLPMAISRIEADGRVESANSLNILSIDNSYGDLPDQCVNEPLPHLLKAEKDAPDAPAPLVWVYPMREYTTSSDPALLRRINLGDHYVCDAINNGLPLCCVVSTDRFLHHGAALYRGSILLSPVPEEAAVLEKLLDLAEKGIGVLLYDTEEALATVPDGNECVIKLSVEQSPVLAREALKRFGYSIDFETKREGTKPPTMAISRHNNGFCFSVCNSNTTTETRLRFPPGAPILCGMETELRDGHACYHFSRGEHRECRILVEQKEGVISCREAPPINARYRRAIRLSGLEDATVLLFPETGCECRVNSAPKTRFTPVPHPDFEEVHDEVLGTYLRGTHVSGSIFFRIGHKGTATEA